MSEKKKKNKNILLWGGLGLGALLLLSSSTTKEDGGNSGNGNGGDGGNGTQPKPDGMTDAVYNSLHDNRYPQYYFGSLTSYDEFYDYTSGDKRYNLTNVSASSLALSEMVQTRFVSTDDAYIWNERLDVYTSFSESGGKITDIGYGLMLGVAVEIFNPFNDTITLNDFRPSEIMINGKGYTPIQTTYPNNHFKGISLNVEGVPSGAPLLVEEVYSAILSDADYRQKAYDVYAQYHGEALRWDYVRKATFDNLLNKKVTNITSKTLGGENNTIVIGAKSSVIVYLNICNNLVKIENRPSHSVIPFMLYRNNSTSKEVKSPLKETPTLNSANLKVKIEWKVDDSTTMYRNCYAYPNGATVNVLRSGSDYTTFFAKDFFDIN